MSVKRISYLPAILPRITWLLLGIASTLLIGSSFSEAGETSGLVIFGDSLSDTGNAAIFYDPLPASPPYFDGRFSNGPVWVERLAERLSVPMPAPSDLGGTNYAFAGATTGSIPNSLSQMDQQVADYLLTHTPGPDELFVFWGGANDFDRGQTDPSLPVQFIHDQVSALAQAGARNVLVVNLPSYMGQVDFPLAEQFNQSLSAAISDLTATHAGLSIVEFDFYGFFDSVLADPLAFGFTNMVDPACADCGGGLNPAPGDIVPNPEEYFFWDRVHPTAIGHQLIGDTTFALLIQPCDFDQDELCNIADLNALLATGPIASGVLVTPNNEQFDLTGDGVIDNQDVDGWLAIAGSENGFASPYKRADANLDGDVDGQDFILWNGSKFTNSLLWDRGDFNGDGVVDGLDFVIWNDNKFTSSDNIQAVPEPGFVMLLCAVVMCLGVVRRRR